MNTKTLIITAALVRLKTLEDLIKKTIHSLPELKVALTKDSKIDKKEIEKSIKSSLDKFIAYRNEYNKIKSAIAKSNASSKVVVNGEEMTVYEAINRKSNFNKQVDNEYISYLLENKDDCDYNIKNVVNKTLNYKNEAIQASLKDGKQPDYTKLDKEFTVDIIDPLNLEEFIKQEDTKIKEFLQEVDIALNIHNATTTIEVEL